MSARRLVLVAALCLVILGMGSAALAAAGPTTAPAAAGTSQTTWILWLLTPIGSVLALFYAYRFYREIMKHDEGTDRMRQIASYVRTGATAYLKQQYKVVAMVLAVLFVVFALMAFGPKEIRSQSAYMPFAFVTGAGLSALSGFFGMRASTRAGGRTANAARTSLAAGLRVAFRGGSVMGLSVVGLALFNISAWFLILYLVGSRDNWQSLTVSAMTIALLSAGMGASTQALFARVGGGIFTKAADVGADLVGKVETGIPEDDPRNPAVIADNVGDNVGDVAGLGADLYESYANSILATCVLGVSAAAALLGGQVDHAIQLKFIVLPMAVAGIGCIASIIGIYFVRAGEDASQKALLAALMRGEWVSVILFALGSGVATVLLFSGAKLGWGIWLSMVTGLVAGVIIGKATERFTSADFKPTRQVADAATTGAGTVIISGLATGMVSTAIPVLTVVVGIILSFAFPGGFQPGQVSLGLYGVAISAVGMLSTLGIMLATDAYGPIADNAGGNAEMSGLPKEVRQRTDALDSLGNTTAATGKGFAIASAALTALALIAALMDAVRDGLFNTIQVASGDVLVGGGYIGRLINGVPTLIPADGQGPMLEVQKTSLAELVRIYNINLMSPQVLAGMFVGSMLVFVFCALSMKAVGRAAGRMVDEVRRQFRELGILQGKGEPDYAACVAISTKGAQRAMMLPSLLAIIVPVVTGVVLGVGGVAGMLASSLATGFIMAVMMANAGGSWDNAKKYIEGGQHGGKGSAAHKAAVVGDTVGDPFKDTSGPSLNILLKLMSMVAVVFAAIIVRYSPFIERWLFH